MGKFLSGRVRWVGVALLCGNFIILPAFSSKAANITLAWDASATTNVVGYNLYYGAASGSYSNQISAGNATTVTISNLVQGTTYYFAATAVDSFAFESDYSAEISTTIPIPNQPPTLAPLADITINENASSQTVNLTGISSGASNELQTLTVTATSSNPSLIPAPTVSYTSPNPTGSINFRPAAFSSGSATITVSVNDGGESNNIVSRSFAVTVRQINQPPIVSAISNRLIAVNTSMPALPFTVGDRETAATSLTLSANSDNTTLVPVANIAFGGSGTNRTVIATPATNQVGLATITIFVSDGTNNANSAFQLTVRPKPDAPGAFRIVSQGG